MMEYLGTIRWLSPSWTVSQPKYQYAKLQYPSSIRLLELLPHRDTTASICCRIIHAKLASSPSQQDQSQQYEALSYTWGDGPNTKEILIQNPDEAEDKAIGQPLLVRPNLYAALRRLRLTNRSRMLWVDAICINQDDILERTAQVKMMRHIYANAQKVLVWLGDDQETGADEIAEAMQIARRFWDSMENDQVDVENSKNAQQHMNRVLSKVGALFSGTEAQATKAWSALCKLFSRPWLSRAWIVQEIVMARDAQIIWAAEQLEWKIFRALASCLHFSSLYLPLPFEVLSDGLNRASNLDALKRSYMEEPLAGVLFPMVSTRNQLAADPRDKFNAILGLLDPKEAAEPEYSIDASTLYRNIAAVTLASSIGIDFLALVDGVIGPSRRLPSWAPDWSQTGIPDAFMFTNPGYRAGAGSKANFTISPDGRDLYVEGIALDILQELGAPYPLSTPYDGTLSIRNMQLKTRRRTKSWFDECAAIFKRHSPQPDEDHDFWRALVCNQDLSSRPLNFEDFERFDAFRAFYRSDAYLESPDPSGEMKQSAQAADAGSFELLAKRGAAGRAFFATATGRVGWAPRYAQPGDLICVLLGATTPSVLRPAGLGGEFEILGECYMHGFMEGEAFGVEGAETTIFKLV